MRKLLRIGIGYLYKSQKIAQIIGLMVLMTCSAKTNDFSAKISFEKYAEMCQICWFVLESQIGTHFGQYL